MLFASGKNLSRLRPVGMELLTVLKLTHLLTVPVFASPGQGWGDVPSGTPPRSFCLMSLMSVRFGPTGTAYSGSRRFDGIVYRVQ